MGGIALINPSRLVLVMRFFLLLFSGFLLTFFFACNNAVSKKENIQGTWQSLWQKDMTLQLHLDDNNRFKVTLNRTGQLHTNLGWYQAEDNVFMVKDSVDYPLPVCNLSDTGKYSFRLSADTLQFKVMEDKCERRSYALQLDKFVRIK